MRRTDSSLKRLEIFQLVAKLGSVQAVSNELNLSLSTISYHLQALESELGVPLLDHKRRPMVLTPAGDIYLKYIDKALGLIRQGRAEAVSGNAVEARHLRLGMIEDFENEIAPGLAVHLANVMPQCDFEHHTRMSHEFLELLRGRKLDLCVANGQTENIGDIQERAILRDPFVLAVPSQSECQPGDYLAGDSPLPFLRYNNNQIIGNLVDAQLRRLKISLPHRFELDSNRTMLAMIAAGSGWTITTPLCYFQARRFHGKVRLHPFPGKSFARYISVFATPECSASVIDLVDTSLRQLVEQYALQPAYEMMPWLKDQFRLLK